MLPLVDIDFLNNTASTGGKHQTPNNRKSKPKPKSPPYKRMTNEDGTTNTDYWDHYAVDYEEEIMDTMSLSRSKGQLARAVKSCCEQLRRAQKPEGSRPLRALDAGCGIGCWIPQLLKHADVVVGTDCSKSLLEVAEADHGVPTVQWDMSGPSRSAEIDALPLADLVVCANGTNGSLRGRAPGGSRTVLRSLSPACMCKALVSSHLTTYVRSAPTQC